MDIQGQQANQPIGLKLKELAKKRKIAISDIAIALNITPQGVYDIFRRTSVSTRTIERFCEAVGVDPQVVMQENTLKYSVDSENPLSRLIEDQKSEIDYLRKLVSQLAQSNAALIEKLGKFEASGLLAEYDA
jgi:transcriptional regulator with XRE-family HTH domain